jgi:ribosome-binding ATPase YchF (GTP1/OBG family)
LYVYIIEFSDDEDNAVKAEVAFEELPPEHQREALESELNEKLASVRQLQELTKAAEKEADLAKKKKERVDACKKRKEQIEQEIELFKNVLKKSDSGPEGLMMFAKGFADLAGTALGHASQVPLSQVLEQQIGTRKVTSL